MPRSAEEGLVTAVPPHPAAPDATAGDGLREAIARALWDACKGEGSHLSWDDGRVSDLYKDRYRAYADAVIDGPLSDVLAAAACDAEKVRRVAVVLARYRYPTRELLLDALDGTP
jgi:hypothetical protein